MFVAQARKREFFGFCIGSVVGLFVDHLIFLFRNLGKRIGRLVWVRKSSEQPVLTERWTIRNNWFVRQLVKEFIDMVCY